MAWTYLLLCADGTYYAGSTVDLEGRLWQHNHSDLGAANTRARRPVQLVWSGWYERIEDAFAFEKQIQGWSRRKREALIRGNWDVLPDLSRRPTVQQRLAPNHSDPTGPDHWLLPT